MNRSQCQKYLRQAFGPRARFAPIDGEGVAVVDHRSDGSEYHVAEVRPRDPKQRDGIHFAALRAAFATLGLRVENMGSRLELVPFELRPGEDVREALDRDLARRSAAAAANGF